MAPSSSDEDDYMTMALPTTAPAQETSLQRLRRERLAAAERGRVKSKAQIEAEAAEARERVMARSLLDDPAVATRSKGFAMMAKMGFKRGDALGRKAAAAEGEEKKAVEAEEKKDQDDDAEAKDAQAQKEDDDNDDSGGEDATPRTEPIKINVRAGRGGIGLSAEQQRKRKLEEPPSEDEATKRACQEAADPLAYRDRVARERERAHREGQVRAAQRLAERLSEGLDGEEEVGNDDDEDEGGDVRNKKKHHRHRTTPLRRVNVLWRGMVRAREMGERDARVRRAAEAELFARRPRYVPTADEEDAYDRLAMGLQPRGAGAVGSVDGDADDSADAAAVPGDEELDEDDEELDAFEALEPADQLRRLTAWLRGERLWCFWCGCGYDDAQALQEACPGEDEDDH
jgi:hypothetical protein